MVYSGAPLRRALPKKTTEEIDIFEDRQRRIQVFTKSLRHVSNTRTDPFAMVALADVDAQHLDHSGLDDMGTCY